VSDRCDRCPCPEVCTAEAHFCELAADRSWHAHICNVSRLKRDALRPGELQESATNLTATPRHASRAGCCRGYTGYE
jgi:hypothetical protein